MLVCFGFSWVYWFFLGFSWFFLVSLYTIHLHCSAMQFRGRKSFNLIWANNGGNKTLMLSGQELFLPLIYIQLVDNLFCAWTWKSPLVDISSLLYFVWKMIKKHLIASGTTLFGNDWRIYYSSNVAICLTLLITPPIFQTGTLHCLKFFPFKQFQQFQNHFVETLLFVLKNITPQGQWSTEIDPQTIVH